MRIEQYDILLEALTEYNTQNASINYGNEVVRYAPTKPTYPLTIFDEIRNVADRNYNTRFDRVSDCGYRVDIFAQTKGKVNKQKIAREIAQQIDTFLSEKAGLRRVSFNTFSSVNDDALYQIIMVYEKPLHENRLKFI